MQTIIDKQKIKSQEPIGHSFAFLVDDFNLVNPGLENSVKKIPITKLYPNFLRKIHMGSYDFEAIRQYLTSSETCSSVIPNSTALLDTLCEEINIFACPTKQNVSIMELNKFLLPIFFMNPERNEFCGKLFLLSKQILMNLFC